MSNWTHVTGIIRIDCLFEDEGAIKELYFDNQKVTMEED